MSSLLSHKSIRVKKSTHGTISKTGEIRPAEFLVDRAQQWKHVTKSLIHYYEGLAAIQTTAAKSTAALTETIQVPFHEGNQFLGNGGWQEALYKVRDDTKLIADRHESFAHTITRTVVKELEGVRSEIKAHISALEKEAVALSDEVDKERETSGGHLTQLQNGIDMFENSPKAMLPQHDPYITHTQVNQQLTKQVHKENDLQSTLIRFQQQQKAFEVGIAKDVQSATKLYDEAQHTFDKEITDMWARVSTALQSVDPECEFKHFASQPEAILDPNMALRATENIQFPGLGHASTMPVKEGRLERKKRFTKSYKESYYVLTPSGYLHERKSNDDSKDLKPGLSLFLPECSLGQYAKESDKSHKWHVEGNKAVKSMTEGKVKSTFRFGGKEIAYSFRARTHADMMGWWAEMDKLSRDTKSPGTGSTPQKSVSPVAAAVANVGLAEPAVELNKHDAPISEGGVAPMLMTSPTPANDEDEDEEGGSSAEEEEEERKASTAPSTPALGTTASAHDEKSDLKADILPVYAGNGTALPEKEKAPHPEGSGGGSGAPHLGASTSA